jgi:hypothetical protein
MFKKISFRLGMDGGLYIGICLGAFISATLILCLLLLLPPNTITLIIVTVALIISSILCAGIVIYSQKMREKSPDQLCTCRYRSSLYTYCRKCALKEKSTGSPDGADQPER